MNPTSEATQHKAAWLSIWKQALSFLVGVVVAAYAVGSARQKTNDLLNWKAEIAPKIERIDSEGSLSFHSFERHYKETQDRQNERLKELERDVKELQKKDDP